METQVIEQPFSNIQLELLKLYSKNVVDEDLKQIKVLIARYFAQKAIEEADEIWDEKGYTAEKILNTHRRTPIRRGNTTLEDLKREQNFKGTDWNKANEWAKSLNIQESAEELIAQLTK